MNTDSIEDAIKAMREGRFVIVVDDKDRENEGDLIMASEKMTPEAMGFMIRYTSGIICVSLDEERLKALDLPQMVHNNTDPHHTAFTVSVDATHGTTTGISAADRAHTIKQLIHPNATPSHFRRPGHVFPLRYCPGGVLKRAGHTETAVDLARIAGFYPSGVICEIVNEDGSMARVPELMTFAKTHKLPIITVADVIRYRRKNEKLVHCIAEAQIPTRFGPFTSYVYESLLDGMQHIALVRGDVSGKSNVLVRVHSECLTGDVFGSQRCDCGMQLELALEKIAAENCGVVVYLRGHEGRGIGLGHKIRAYNLQEKGRDTVEANEELGLPVDSREYGIGAQILSDLGVTTIRLLTNNPAKYSGLAGYDLQIIKKEPLISKVNKDNSRYLLTKKLKLGHSLENINIEV